MNINLNKRNGRIVFVSFFVFIFSLRLSCADFPFRVYVSDRVNVNLAENRNIFDKNSTILSVKEKNQISFNELVRDSAFILLNDLKKYYTSPLAQQKILFQVLTGGLEKTVQSLTREIQDKITESATDESKRALNPFLEDDFSQNILVLPDPPVTQDIYYDYNKLSIEDIKSTAFTDFRANTPQMAQVITEKIKKYESDLSNLPQKEGALPVTLLAARFKYYISPLNVRTINIQLLWKLSSFSQKLEPASGNDQVVFNSVTVDDSTNKNLVVLTDISIDFSHERTGLKKPTYQMDVKFGTFKAYARNSFEIDSSKYQDLMVLNGHLKDKEFVVVKVAFADLKIDLLSQQVTKLSTLTSPGLKIFGKTFQFPGFKLQKVNDEFSKEINKMTQQKKNEFEGKVKDLLNETSGKIIQTMFGAQSL